MFQLTEITRDPICSALSLQQETPREARDLQARFAGAKLAPKACAVTWGEVDHARVLRGVGAAY
ncbi:hypothetical protein DB354_10095 [Opitutus sp. ER46]|nr:hypothetical protein DB354_10095 [Opitutus sp. ER46]